VKIEKIASQDVFAPPGSYAQERLWFLDQLEPGMALYNIPYISTVRGSVHRTAFNRAVNRLIARHESLRTYFIESGGSPKQAIHPQLSVEVGWEDLSRLDSRNCAGRLQEICTQVTSTPFDLGKAPLFRVMLVGTGRETTIITTIHHIVSDGWSIGIFQRDLAALYHEELGGKAASLPLLRIQYADFAIGQRRKLEGEGLSRLRQYWTRQLEGATTILEIPGDYPRPLKQTFTGEVSRFDIPPELTGKVVNLSSDGQATLFMTLFAAFAVLLSRLSGNQDLLVGTPIAGRKSPEVEDLIGLFVNTLVLRARVDPGMPFRQLLSDVKTMTLEAFEHQDMPFEKLVIELNPKRDLSHSPLIQVLFSLQNIPPLQKVIAEGGSVSGEVGMSENLDGHTGTAKFDLAMFVSEVADHLQCAIEFNTDLFSMATVREFGDYFVRLLEGIVSDPGAAISSYPLMPPESRQLRLENGRGRAVPYSAGRGCHQLFEAQCQKSSTTTAVVRQCDELSESLTYVELNQYANRIARYLQTRRVESGDRVAICLPRGPQQVACVLAIVKAGAAYVPIDPDYPVERAKYILGDSGSVLLLGTSELRSSLGDCIETVVLSEHDAEIGQQGAENLVIPHSPETPLYVIYTSGSTGRPKGVVMPHRAIVNLVEWQARVSRNAVGEETLQYAPLNFDVASQEIFSTLTSGGCLRLVDEKIRRDSRRLLDHLRSHNVSRLFLPPVALEQLANAAADTQAEADRLREVIVAGDKLQITENVRRFFSRRPGARLVNQYGPTETHVVSVHTLEGDASAWPAHPPIGTPVDNVRLYVLDENLEPVPPRVSGELYVGGAAVALGYLTLPEESRKRFLPDRFEDAQRLLYRTGDVCRYDANGVLTFLGRGDHQIKLRGFRIEPGEIEVVLKRHASVEDAVVVKRQSPNGDDQLVAYVILRPEARLERIDLRSHLAEKLPAYMVPAHFVRLEAFPLTSSGKLDRLRLPAPAEVETVRAPESVYIPPRTSVEQFLADCWCTLLQIDKVSIDDNFFDLGGHSLTATQLVSRVRDEYGVELPLFRVFERPTLELLALEILQRRASEEERSDLDSLLNELESLSKEELESILSQAGEGS
jgi:amino acid adenylation domain-containing protein